MSIAEFFGFKPRLQSRPRPQPRRPQLRQGDSFVFLGRQVTLQCVVTLRKKVFFSAFEDVLLLHVPQAQWVTDARYSCYDLLVEFYEKEGRAWLTKRTQFWAQQMKLYPKKVKFRAPRTRWGSCSSAGSINFNWKLVVFTPEVIDYVIIHELAHLQHLNHSRDFWKLVESHCPDYKAHEKTLKNNHTDVQFLKT